MATTTLLKQLFSSPPYPESTLPLIDPVRSWDWPVRISANFSRDLIHLERPQSGRTRLVHTEEGSFWLMAFRNHDHPTALPPHPGSLPSEHNSMTIAGYGFMDGSFARFDFRRYPQVFRREVIWRIFACNPSSGHVAGRPEYECPLLYWRQQEKKFEASWIINLYARKHVVEQDLIRFFNANPNAATYMASGAYTLPAYDDTTMETFHQRSVDFDRAVQLIGYTQRWIADLDALHSWLNHVNPWKTRLKPVNNADMWEEYQGCWLSSDISLADEQMLRACPVPIFVALRVKGPGVINVPTDGFDFSNGENSRPYLTNWYLTLRGLPAAPDPQSLPFPRHLQWEQPVIRDHLPSLPPLLTTQGYFYWWSSAKEHIMHNKEYRSTLGPWGCPHWWPELAAGSVVPGNTMFLHPDQWCIEADTDPQSSAGQLSVTPTTPINSSDFPAVGDPAAPTTHVNPSESSVPIPNHHHDIGGPVTPCPTDSLDGNLLPHNPSGGVTLTDATGKPRAPAIVDGKSELNAFGFPITGPHPLFRNRGHRPGSYWYHYDSDGRTGSIDVIKRPRALDFSRFEQCPYLFIWPNPSGGGFIFFITDIPIGGRPQLGLRDGAEEEDEEDISMGDAAAIILGQPPEPLTPPTTPPPAEDVAMRSSPGEDIHMRSPLYARPGEPGTPPGTPPSQRRRAAVRTPSHSPTSDGRRRGRRLIVHALVLRLIVHALVLRLIVRALVLHDKGEVLHTTSITAGVGPTPGGLIHHPQRGFVPHHAFILHHTGMNHHVTQLEGGIHHHITQLTRELNDLLRQIVVTHSGIQRSGIEEVEASLVVVVVVVGISHIPQPYQVRNPSASYQRPNSVSRGHVWQQGTSRNGWGTAPDWGPVPPNADGWGVRESTSTPASRAAPGWGPTRSTQADTDGWGPVPANADGWGVRESTSTPASRAAPGWGPTRPTQADTDGWGPVPPNADGSRVQGDTLTPASRPLNSTTAPVPPAKSPLKSRVAADPSKTAPNMSRRLPSIPPSLAERIHGPRLVSKTSEASPRSPLPSLKERIHGPTSSETSEGGAPSEKSLFFDRLSANNNWVRRTRDEDVDEAKELASQSKRVRSSQNRLELHFRVWYKNFGMYFNVPPIPPTLCNESKGSRTLSSMYQEAYQWSQDMINEIEETRARGDVSTFTDAEFDSLIATLGWEALLRRVDPDLQSTVDLGHSAPPPTTIEGGSNESAQEDDEGDLYD